MFRLIRTEQLQKSFSRLTAALVMSAISFSGAHVTLAQESKKPEKPQAGSAPKAADKTKPTAKDPAPNKNYAFNPYGVFHQYQYIAAIDTDEDGAMSKKELEAATKQLQGLDKNEDGKLEASEYLKEPPVSPTVSKFPSLKALDADSDGVIDEKEIEAASKVLTKLDANKDGKLDHSEYAMASPRGPAIPKNPAQGGGGRSPAGSAPGGGRKPSAPKPSEPKPSEPKAGAPKSDAPKTEAPKS